MLVVYVFETQAFPWSELRASGVFGGIKCEEAADRAGIGDADVAQENVLAGIRCAIGKDFGGAKSSRRGDDSEVSGVFSTEDAACVNDITIFDDEVLRQAGRKISSHVIGDETAAEGCAIDGGPEDTAADGDSSNVERIVLMAEEAVFDDAIAGDTTAVVVDAP